MIIKRDSYKDDRFPGYTIHRIYFDDGEIGAIPIDHEMPQEEMDRMAEEWHKTLSSTSILN